MRPAPRRRQAGLGPEVRHLANPRRRCCARRRTSTWCAAASRPTGCRRHPDVVTATDLGLVPAMTVQARLAVVKRVPAGAGCPTGTPT